MYILPYNAVIRPNKKVDTRRQRSVY
uniref:Uncharacterized protein n=1 Tax=Arundo donax TaxID=35708 RepID=A0A0A8YEL9_ARUDO